ncbi:MAG: hypothetical protein HYU56_02495 [Candidatus Aenigmarchaeota archaeon]|nr:hypothetical protein [Candidatus Aenigmarchaeota archaeon]
MADENFVFRGHFPVSFRDGKARLPKKWLQAFPEGKAYALITSIGEDGAEYLDIYPQRNPDAKVELPVRNHVLHIDQEARRSLGIAYIDGSLTAVGMIDHAEFWDTGRLKAYMKSAPFPYELWERFHPETS